MVGGYSLGPGRDFCEESIAAAFDRQCDNLKPLERIAPDLAEPVRSVFNAKEAENEAFAQSVFAEEDACMEAFGLAAAKRDLESDGLLEEDVMELLLSFADDEKADGK